MPSPRPPPKADSNVQLAKRGNDYMKVGARFISRNVKKALVPMTEPDLSAERAKHVAAGNENMRKAKEAAALPTRRMAGMVVAPSTNQAAHEEGEFQKFRERQALFLAGNFNMGRARAIILPKTSAPLEKQRKENSDSKKRRELFEKGNLHMKDGLIAASTRPDTIQQELKKLQAALLKDAISGKINTFSPRRPKVSQLYSPGQHYVNGRRVMAVE